MSKSIFYKILGPLLFLSTLFLNPPYEMTKSGFKLLGIILWMAIWWISEVVPIAVTALLPIILFPESVGTIMSLLQPNNTSIDNNSSFFIL